MKMGYDKRNDQIYCTSAYSVKEILKNYGFRYCGIDQTWAIAMPKGIATLGNLICDVTVDCGVDYADLCEFIGLSLPATYADVMMHMDAAHIEKLRIYLGA